MTLPDLGRWLFHTPARLLAAVLVLVVIGAVTMWAAQDATGSPDPPPSAVAARPEPTASTAAPEPIGSSVSTPGAVDEESHGSHRVPAPGPPRRVAARYLRVFLSDTGTRAEWLARLDRLSTGTLARLNATVPRTRVPDATLHHLTLTALSMSYASLRAVLADGTRLTVALVLDAEDWKVTEVAPEPTR